MTPRWNLDLFWGIPGMCLEFPGLFPEIPGLFSGIPDLLSRTHGFFWGIPVFI